MNQATSHLAGEAQNHTADKKSELPIENCPKCHRILTGTIEVSSALIGGINVVVMEETANRNWILCDFCNRTICKSCCIMPESGYCNNCFIELKIAPYLP